MFEDARKLFRVKTEESLPPKTVDLMDKIYTKGYEIKCKERLENDEWTKEINEIMMVPKLEKPEIDTNENEIDIG